MARVDAVPARFLQIEPTLDVIQRNRGGLGGAGLEQRHQSRILTTLRNLLIELSDCDQQELAAIGEANQHVVFARLVQQTMYFGRVQREVNRLHRSNFSPRIQSLFPSFDPIATIFTVSLSNSTSKKTRN